MHISIFNWQKGVSPNTLIMIARSYKNLYLPPWGVEFDEEKLVLGELLIENLLSLGGPIVKLGEDLGELILLARVAAA